MSTMAVFSGQMTKTAIAPRPPKLSKPRVIVNAEVQLAHYLETMGHDKNVGAFLQTFGNVKTRSTYSWHLSMYFDYLKSMGIAMSPTELLFDNLACTGHTHQGRRGQEETQAMARRLREQEDQR
jgi:hypothetical protein